jgi:hypothetical protein
MNPILPYGSEKFWNVNSKYFTEVRDKGIPKNVLTNLKRSSESGIDFGDWDWESVSWVKQEYKRCTEGFTVGGVFMPPRLYFHINFWKLQVLDEKSGVKRLGLPKLRDVDWMLGYAIHQAINEKKNLMILAARRSSKTSICVSAIGHNMVFNSYATNYIGAWSSKYTKIGLDMLKQGLQAMVNTPFWNSIGVRSDDEVSLYDLEKDQSNGWMKTGRQSTCWALNFKDKPEAASGKSIKLALHDEVGIWPNLMETYGFAKETWADGGTPFGTGFFCGTGGEIELGSKDFREMFYHPDRYNMLVFQHPEEKESCGLFIPSYLCKGDSYRKDGWTNMAAAIKAEREEREKLQSYPDKSQYKKYLQNYPITPEDAFDVNSRSIFDILSLKKQYLKTIKNPKGELGLFVNEGGKVEFKTEIEGKQLKLCDRDNKEGCIVIYEHPEKNTKLLNNYIAALDPYQHDAAIDSDSFSYGCLVVYKRSPGESGEGSKIVAEYMGRPSTLDEFLSQCICLQEYYNNCKCMYENNTKGTKEYYESKRKLWLLSDHPTIIKDTVTKNSLVTRRYGVHMTKEIKNWGLTKLRDWLSETRDGDGEQLLTNTDFIWSPILLDELMKFDPDKGNFDYVSAMIVLIIYIEESYKIPVKEYKPTPNIFEAWDKKYFIPAYPNTTYGQHK